MPFTTMEFAGWRIESDVERTRAAYSQVEQGRAERCGCLYCRNFVAARHAVYPPAVVMLLESLGIAITKEAEVTEYGDVTDGSALYGGWFHFFGDAVKDAEAWAAPIEAEPTFQVRFQHSYHHSYHRPRLREPTGANGVLEFMCRVPWLLDEQPPVQYQPKS